MPSKLSRIEQRTSNPQVAGSIPAEGATVSIGHNNDLSKQILNVCVSGAATQWPIKTWRLCSLLTNLLLNEVYRSVYE